MAQRLTPEERVRVEAMAQAGTGAAGIARRLGRHRSTIHRELDRGGGRDGYDAEVAQVGADARARRPKPPKFAADPEMAAAVNSLLAERWSPHAISAHLRGEGRRVAAETIYAACYDHTGSRGLPEGSQRLLPTAQARGPPHTRAEPTRRFQAHSGSSRSPSRTAASQDIGRAT